MILYNYNFFDKIGTSVKNEISVFKVIWVGIEYYIEKIKIKKKFNK